MEAIVLSKNQRKRANRRARRGQNQNQLVVYEQPQNSVSLQSVQKVSLPGQGTSRSARRRRAQKQRGGGVKGSRQTGNLYLASLIDPENNPGAKIPDLVTFPSATLQLTADGAIAPTGTGDGVSMILDPILGTPDGSTLFPIYRGANSIAGGNYAWANIGWVNAASIRGYFDSYRPVSAVLYAEFIGASTNDAGQITMGIVPRSGAATAAQIQALVSGFGSAISQSFTKTVPIRNGAVVTWKPQDNKDLEYKDTGSNTAADHELPIIFFATGGQNTSANIRYRVVVNFELIPTSDTTQFISATPSQSNITMLEQALNWGSQTYNNMSPFVDSVSPYVQPLLYQGARAAANLGLTYLTNRQAGGRGNTMRITY